MAFECVMWTDTLFAQESGGGSWGGRGGDEHNNEYGSKGAPFDLHSGMQALELLYEACSMLI